MKSELRDAGNGPVVIQRCDRFVARTMNWLYDHLRFVPSYESLVVCDELENRQEFPELTAWGVNLHALPRAIWKRVSGEDVDPFIARRLRRRSPRVLHSHFGYVAAGDYGLWQSLSVPWIIGFYGADVYALGRLEEWRARYKKVFAGCTRALALGPVMARHLEQLGCPAQKIVVHALGVEVSDLPDVPRRRDTDELLRVLFAGTMREKKGIEYALRAVAAVRDAGIRIKLDVVAEATNKPGDRETQSAVLQLIEELGLADVVVRHSFLTFRELLALALRCHVFLAPSVTAADGDAEGTPFVLQQMMATTMPVIATRHSDIPFLFGDLGHLLVAERDAPAIAERLVSYAQRPDLLIEHGRLFRQQILRQFDVRHCAVRLAGIYDSVRGTPS